MVDTIITSGILPRCTPAGQPPLLVSVSANSGLHEQILAQKFAEIGSPYRVIAGDMSAVRRVRGQAAPLQFDASFLPFPPGRVSAIFDRLGVIWHEADTDLKTRPDRVSRGRSTKNTLEIFARFREALHEGGVIIVDDWQCSAFNTGAYLNGVLGQNSHIQGFKTSSIGEGPSRMRVYTKISDQEKK
jgi:hypothetical protein